MPNDIVLDDEREYKHRQAGKRKTDDLVNDHPKGFGI
jgi:hypothetical protein